MPPVSSPSSLTLPLVSGGAGNSATFLPGGLHPPSSSQRRRGCPERNCSAFLTSSPPLLIRTLGGLGRTPSATQRRCGSPPTRRSAQRRDGCWPAGMFGLRYASRWAGPTAESVVSRAATGGGSAREASTRRRRCTTARETAEKAGSAAAAIQGRLSRWPSRASSDQSPGPVSAS